MIVRKKRLLLSTTDPPPSYEEAISDGGVGWHIAPLILFIAHMIGMIAVLAWSLYRYLGPDRDLIAKTPIPYLSTALSFSVTPIVPVLLQCLLIGWLGYKHPHATIIFSGYSMCITSLAIAIIGAYTGQWNTMVAFGLGAALNLSLRRQNRACPKAESLLQEALKQVVSSFAYVAIGLAFLVLEVVYASLWITISTYLLVLQMNDLLSGYVIIGLSLGMTLSMAWTQSVLLGTLQALVSHFCTAKTTGNYLAIMQRVAQAAACTAIFDSILYGIEIEEEELGNSLIGIVLERVTRSFTDSYRTSSQLLYTLIGVKAAPLSSILRETYEMMFFDDEGSELPCAGVITWSLSLFQLGLAVVGAFLGYSFNYRLAPWDGIWVAQAGVYAALSFWASSIFNSILQAVILSKIVHNRHKDNEKKSKTGSVSAWKVVTRMALGGDNGCPCSS